MCGYVRLGVVGSRAGSMSRFGQVGLNVAD